MTRNPHTPGFDDLPEILPIFPLAGVLLLPEGHLPLNIFEPRYLKMVDHALGGHKMIGMIQPNPKEGAGALYKVGCAGKIIDYRETEDGRYLITLCGRARFQIQEELSVNAPFRQVRAHWASYKTDLERTGCLDIDREKLCSLLRRYMEAHEMSCDWGAVDGASDSRLMTCLSMIGPFDPEEKQALLEAPCCKARAQMFMAMLEMAVCERCSSAQH